MLSLGSIWSGLCRPVAEAGTRPIRCVTPFRLSPTLHLGRACENGGWDRLAPLGLARLCSRAARLGSAGLGTAGGLDADIRPLKRKGQ